MKPLPLAQLYKSCTLKDLPFTSTRSLEPLAEIVGQARAQEAVRFAMAMPHGGYNVYAVGRNGLGKRTMMLRYLHRYAEHHQPVHDWCYVANFDEPRSPKVIKLPAGRGADLRLSMEKLMARLVKAIPQTFDSDAYLERAERLKSQYETRHETELNKLAVQAKRRKVLLTINNPGGYRLVALNGEEPHTAETFAALQESERQKFETVIDALEKRLRKILRKLADLEQEYSEKQQQLNQETLDGVSGHLLDALEAKFADEPAVVVYLKAVRKDLLDNLDIFLEDNDEQTAFAYAALDRKMPRRYQVNQLVSRKSGEVPVIVEDNPTYHNLFGYVENVTWKGTVFTDFSLIRSGSLHRANGGYLLMDANKVLEQPFVWDGLKRALRSKSLAINSLERELTLSGTISLEPDPIPLSVKIVLFGDRDTWMLLQHYDAEFAELFRVAADFENEMPRTVDSQQLYAKFIASLVSEKTLLHCDRKAVARLIEYSARLAEHQDKLSLHAADIANLIRESDYWARQAGANLIRREHVEQALSSARHREGRIRDQFYNSIRDRTTLLSVDGKVIGQVNALSVLSAGGQEFGLPNRITALCRYGDGEVIDIERDVKLGGNIHSKGVMILSAFLAGHFAREEPMHLSASIAFEQSYSEVDGDSASMAELCALLSALAEVPVLQQFAVTGSINQFGEVQPVGGVNEKIEGFHAACSILGLTGAQAVLLPASNVQNLMLDQAVTDSVQAGQFRIFAVRHVTEAIELLTGLPAGRPDRKGRYPKGTVFGRIQQRLDRLRRAEREQDGGADAPSPAARRRRASREAAPLSGPEVG